MGWLKSFGWFVAGGVLGTGFGVALGFFLFPFIFPPPPAAEQLTQADQQSRVVAEGTFIHANKNDPVHWGKGNVEVRQDSVYLGPDFEVGSGTEVSRLSRAEGHDPHLKRPAGSAVRGPRAAEVFSGEPALFNSSRHRPFPVPERDHLV